MTNQPPIQLYAPGSASGKTNSSVPLQQWDADYCRRNRRAQHDAKLASKRSARLLHLPTTTESARPRLPATSAAFQLGSRRRQSLRHVSLHSTSRRRIAPDLPRAPFSAPTPPTVRHERSPGDASQIAQVRAEAFSQLQRSVAESGEQLVRRMQEWESRRSTSEQPTDSHTNMSAEFSPRARAFSARATNGFCNHHLFRATHRPLSLGDASLLGSDYLQPSALADSPNEDDDVEFELSSSVQSLPRPCAEGAPTLSHTPSSSMSSSLDGTSFQFLRPSRPTCRPPLESIPSASREEKAIAALTLALANGAGSMNDYGSAASVSMNEDLHMQPEDVGAMWD